MTESRKKPEGGIGGTGITGILTAFGSLVVNGQRVALAADTKISDAFGTAASGAIAVGQSLTIEATQVDGALVARRVHITHPVIGFAEAVDADGLTGRVAGVPVRLEPAAIGRLTAGMRVAVSGVWRDGGVIASRVAPLAAPGPDVIAGVVNPPVAGGLRIGPLDLSAPGLDIPLPGSFATMLGRATGNRFTATQITPGRFTGAAGPLVALSIEGYLEPTGAAPFYTVTGLGHSFDRDARLAPFAGQRTLFTGAYDGTFVVREGLSLPENLSQRTQALNAALNGQGRAPVSAR